MLHELQGYIGYLNQVHGCKILASFVARMRALGKRAHVCGGDG